MPNKCSVSGCNTNFLKHISEGGEQVPVYRFPKDIERRKEWVKALPNKLTLADVTNNMTVCAIHFPECTKWKITGRNRSPLEPPTFFPNVPESCIPRTPVTKQRPTTKATASARRRDPDWQMKKFAYEESL